MQRSYAVALAIGLVGGCGGHASDGNDDADATDVTDGDGDTTADDDVTDDGATPDAAPDAPAGPAIAAPRWSTWIEGVGAFHRAATVGDQVVVGFARAIADGPGELTIAPGTDGQLVMNYPFQYGVMWLDGTDGSIERGRVVAQRTSSMVGGLSRELVIADGAGGVMVTGDLVGEMRFHPGGTGERVERAVVESTNPAFIEAADPFVTSYDASGTPAHFTRGVTTGSLTNITRFNFLEGAGALAGGDWMLAGRRESPTFAIAGTTLGSGPTGYVARIGTNGAASWVRTHSGGLVAQQLQTGPTGNAYLRAEVWGDSTLFANSATPLAVAGVEDTARRVIVARVDAAGTLAWSRQLDCGALCYADVLPLADGGVLLAVRIAGAGGADVTYELREGTVVRASGSAPPPSTVLFRFTAEGALAATSTFFGATLGAPRELASGEIRGLAYYYGGTYPAAFADLTLPAGVDPNESPITAIVRISPQLEVTRQDAIGVNLYPETAALPDGLLVASQWYDDQNAYTISPTGEWVPSPACPYDMCLQVLAY